MLKKVFKTGLISIFTAIFTLVPALELGNNSVRVFASTPRESIYTDDISSNWVNWSWGANINFQNPTPVQSGSKSIWIALSPWGGIYFHSNTSVYVPQYSYLAFAIQGKAANEKFKVLIYGGDDKVAKELKLDQYGGDPAVGKYSVYKIPVADLGTQMVNGIAIQDTTGTYQSDFFVDSVEFAKDDTNPVPVPDPTPTPEPDPEPIPVTNPPAFNTSIYDDGIASNWVNWSWNANINFDNPSPVQTGSKSAWVSLAPWGGLYFHANSAINLSQYSYLTFAIQAKAANENLKVLVYGDGGNVVKNLTLDQYGGSPATDKYTVYKISVADLGTQSLTGIAIQDNTGSQQAPFFVDAVGLINDGTTPAPTPNPEPQPDPDPNPNPDPVTPPLVDGFSSSAGKVYKGGSAIYLNGINWFGFETANHVVHGLWSRNYKDMIRQMKSLGFNAVRLPVNPSALHGVAVNGIDYAQNPDLVGLNSLQVLDKIIYEMNNQGMYILLDHHRPDDNAISELWYTGSYSEANWISDLKLMADRYRNVGNLVGIDIKNEPHGSATWGTGNLATDFNKAAERAGSQILGVNPNLLIFVEGVSENPVCSSSYSHGWGINLEAQKCAPISTSAIPANKLVLEPHVYGPDVYMQPYFNDPSFPNNMPNIWETQFGYLANNPAYTLAIGEWGGKYGASGGNPMDVTFQNKFVDYLRSKGIYNSFYWSFNPNSGDTGGILQDDWTSVWQGKVDLIHRYFAGK